MIFKIIIFKVLIIALLGCNTKSKSPTAQGNVMNDMAEYNIICKALKALTNHKKQHFVSIRLGDSISENSYVTDLKIHNDFDPVTVYKSKDGLIIQNRLHEGADLETIKAIYTKLNKEILECLGNQWEGVLETYDGNPKIRIYRYIIKHKYQKNLGEMVTILRQHLQSDNYLISFSYQ